MNDSNAETYAQNEARIMIIDAVSKRLRVRLFHHSAKLRKSNVFLEGALLAILYLCMSSFPFKASNPAAFNLILLCAFGFIRWAFVQPSLCKRDMFCFAMATVAALYSVNTEGLRYALTIILVVFWRKATFRNLPLYCAIIALYGSLCCCVQFFSGVERVYGFSNPTQMSCLLLAFEIYLLFCIKMHRGKAISMIAAVSCVLALYLTGTRSTFLIGLCAFSYYIGLTIISLFGISKKQSILILTLIASLLLLLSYKNEIISRLFLNMRRTNQASSSYTRLYVYQSLLKQTVSNARSILIGFGGGYAERFLSAAVKSDVYFPSHQDYLLFFCEYGVLGLVSLYYAFLKDNKAWFYVFIVYSACSFHNAVLNSALIAFLAITALDIQRKMPP